MIAILLADGLEALVVDEVVIAVGKR